MKLAAFITVISLTLSFLMWYLDRKEPDNNKLHVILIKDVKDNRAFFRYSKDDIPIVSAHRGGATIDFPENCLATFEHTLKHVPAIFEIDPRMTKDSVMVLMHDATLDRTTTGSGRVADHTYADLQQLFLKDPSGWPTRNRIPTLEEAIEWARGKTVLNLDIKDVPPPYYVEIIRRMKAEAFVMLTVHRPEQAAYYLRELPDISFSAHVLSVEAFEAYNRASFPWGQCIAYVGSQIGTQAHPLYDLLHAKGASCMISAAPSYDKLANAEARRAAYFDVFADGADVLESDVPIEVGSAASSFIPMRAKRFSRFKFFDEIKGFSPVNPQTGAGNR